MLDEGVGSAGDERSVQNQSPLAGHPRAVLSFQVLGPLEVLRGGTLVQLRGTRERTLLAILLSERNRAVPVSRLVAGLWGAQPPASAERTVQAYVARLRPLLEPERPEAGWSVLVTSPTGYCLRVDEAAFDAASFARLVDRAQSALVAGAPDLALARFRRAEAMWRGAMSPTRTWRTSPTSPRSGTGSPNSGSPRLLTGSTPNAPWVGPRVRSATCGAWSPTIRPTSGSGAS